jgi:ribose-phosphate pyrophosphokinase
VPITAKLVADLISRAGADRVLTMDLHAAQIQGFFDVPVDHLFAAPVLLDAIRELEIPDLVIVSPDAGGVERARAIAKRLGVGLAFVDKRRTAPNVAEVMHIIGGGWHPLILDIIDAGTLTRRSRVEAAGRQPVLARRARRALRPRAQKDQIGARGGDRANTTPVEGSQSSKLRALSVAKL